MLQIEMLPVDRLVPYIRNARTHSEDQIAQIAASIAEFDFTNPPIAPTDASVSRSAEKCLWFVQLLAPPALWKFYILGWTVRPVEMRPGALFRSRRWTAKPPRACFCLRNIYGFSCGLVNERRKRVSVGFASPRPKNDFGAS